MALRVESETKSAELAETKATIAIKSQNLALREFFENADLKEQLGCKNKVISELQGQIE